MVSSGSLADVWFVELLRVIEFTELFLLCRIYGGIWICISYRFVRRFVLARSVVVDGFTAACLFWCLCFVCSIIFTGLYIKVLPYVAEAVFSVGSKRDSCYIEGGWGSQISWQSVHEGGKVVSPTRRPPLPPRKYSWYSFLLEAESTPGP
jgi:hypothetical protein